MCACGCLFNDDIVPLAILLKMGAAREFTRTVNANGIWSEIDLLEGDPVHRGAAMRNPCFKSLWLRAEGDEWQDLWEKGAFKKWNRSDLLPNDHVFTSRYVDDDAIIIINVLQD